MKWNFLFIFTLLLELSIVDRTEAFSITGAIKKVVTAPIKAIKKVASAAGRIGRKLLDIPPKFRSRFDRYPIYVMRYHQFIWARHFKRYLDNIDDGKPRLPNPHCWDISCWMSRNKFKLYWNLRAPIPPQGNNSPPFLHRRCRIPNMTSGNCLFEHLRHDYYWRMFMWVGRYGFPMHPERKRLCVTDYCRFLQRRWDRYWKNFFLYTSLIPVIRPYDYNWKMWTWRYGGNAYRLQQIVGPALVAIGQGQMLMGGMMGGGGGMNINMIMGGGRMTYEMKNAILKIMQQDLSQSRQVSNTAQLAVQRQQAALMMVMNMPAFPSAVTAQIQMRSMMRGMAYQQSLQQMRLQQMLQYQIMSMARYLRGSCGCSMCSGHPSMGMSQMTAGGPSMYIHQHGMMHSVPTGMGMYPAHHHMQTMGMYPTQHHMQAHRLMNGGIMPSVGINAAIGTMGLNTMPANMDMPMYAINTPMELKMRVQALYMKNNIAGNA